MRDIQDNEFVLYKSLAGFVKSKLLKPLNQINLKSLKLFSDYDNVKSLFLNCETYDDLGENSKKLKSKKEKLLSLLAVQDRIEKILKRNEQRIDFINARLSQVGIYNDSVEKKQLSSAISKESKNVSEITLNLNPKNNKNIVFKYFAGEIVAFRDDMLDFSLEENREVVIDGSLDFFHQCIFTFPYCVATIPDAFYMVAGVKNNVLKECILFVASKLKTQSIYESNKELGGLLENSARISSISEYANELRNYFNVSAKQCIKLNYPEFAEEADKVLRCNERSEYLPISKQRTSVDIEVENQIEELGLEESASAQDEGESDSQEDNSVNSREALLSMLLSDEDLDDEQTDFVADEEAEENKSDIDLDKTLKDLDDLLTEDDGDDEENKNG